LRILQLEPTNLDVAYEVAKMQLESGSPEKAIKSLEDTLRHMAGSATDITATDQGLWRQLQSRNEAKIITFDFIHMLAELYLIQERFEHTVSLIEHGSRCVLSHNKILGLDFRQVPLDLRVKYAISQLHLGQPQLARSHIDVLLRQPLGRVADLFYDVAEAYRATKYYASALSIYMSLQREDPDTYDQVRIWSRIAECYFGTEQWQEAKLYYEKIVNVHPNDHLTLTCLARCYQELNE
jgi:tetratricopeptide (TPR) repeat protein